MAYKRYSSNNSKSGGAGGAAGGAGGGAAGGAGGGAAGGAGGGARGVRLPPARRRRQTRNDMARILAVLIAAIAVLAYTYFHTVAETERRTQSAPAFPQGAAGSYEAAGQNRDEVCFIDVGQGDSVLITGGGAVVLIDAGEEAYAGEVQKQLDARGIAKIDALIGTHPHSDHIGGLAAVIESYDIGALYMPRETNNTRQFEKTIAAARSKGLSITAPAPGDELVFADGLKLLFLGPAPGGAASINDSSIIVKAVFEGEGESGGMSFLFTGDAERDAERFLVGSGADLRADVLKVAHHGSATSTGADFLSAVAPAYAIIQCGADNPYGHPDASVLELLDEFDVSVLRTDTSGTIAFSRANDARQGFSIYTERGG